jgi:TRAP-type mannitol/chloroaromatic compound transport system substrate-binding protein
MLHILRKCIVLCSVGLLWGCSQEQTVDESSTINDRIYTLKLAQTWSKDFPIFGESVQNMARYAKEMSNGRLIVRIDSANKHKAPLGVFDMVRSGQYDLGHTSSYYWKGKDINTMFFTTMPFGLTSPEQFAWFYGGDGQRLMNKVYDKFGLMSFPGGNTGNQMGGWFQKEINTVADLQGLKMRIPGFAGEIMAELGAKPTNVAPGELYTALERGAIDALEWVGPSLDLRMGFQQIAKYYYTGWHEPGADLQFLINKRSFARLPSDLQAVLVNAMRLSAFEMYAYSYHESAVNLATLQRDYPNVQIKTFPKPVMRALREANDKLLSEFASRDPLTKEIIESQQSYLKMVRHWTQISDQAYLNALE